MKKFLLVILSLLASAVFSEVTIKSTGNIFSSYGLATEDQKVVSTMDGVYSEVKNGYEVEGIINIKGSIENRVDLFIDLSTKGNTGSPYLELMLPPSTPSSFSIGISNLYAKFYLSDLLFKNPELLGTDVDLKILFGKFGLSSSNFSISRMGLDSLTKRVNLSNSLAVALENKYVFKSINQTQYGTRANISLNIASGGLFGEDIVRLYDTDGGISEHGRVVIGEYAPQLFANIALNDYVLPIGQLSFGVGYTMNGGGIYSGNSFSASTKIIPSIIKEKLNLPVSISFSLHEKNIDILANTSDNSLLVDTTGFRETMQIGGAVGLQYIKQTFGILGIPKPNWDLTISGAYKSISHIYRENLNILTLGIDTQYSINPKLFVGGGFILGTLSDVTWKTMDSVSSSKDDYLHNFKLADNFGYEAYIGMDFFGTSKLVAGFSHKQGLSMNYGIEASQSGMVKFKKLGSSLSDGLWETMGIFLKASIAL